MRSLKCYSGLLIIKKIVFFWVVADEVEFVHALFFLLLQVIEFEEGKQDFVDHVNELLLFLFLRQFEFFIDQTGNSILDFLEIIHKYLFLIELILRDMQYLVEGGVNYGGTVIEEV